MASIYGITGYNNKAGTSQLIAIWKNAPMIYNTSTAGWNKAPIHLTASLDVDFENFVDCLFLVNGTDNNYCYNGTHWNVGNVNDSVKGKYIKKYNTRLYLGNVTINGTSYPSRIWRSDVPKADNTLTWGIESGSDLVQTASSAAVTSSTATFEANNIKIGDTFVITSGTNAGEYKVKSVDSETQITLTDTLTYTASGSSFWVGGNFIDIETDDGDEITGLGTTSNSLIIFKNTSTHRYVSTEGNIRKCRSTVGTSTDKSIVNLNNYTYFYSPSRGFLKTDGLDSLTISNALHDIVDNITTANATKIVGWCEDNRYVCWYVGNVTDDDGETYTDLIVVFDSLNNTWSTRSYGLGITCACTRLESGILYNYIGDNSDAVYKVNYGTDFNDGSINFSVVTHPIFPAGPASIIDFSRVRFYIRNGPDIQILYKLIYRPMNNLNQWSEDTTWRSLQGSAGSPRSEFTFPEGSRASGVMFKFIESSTQESFLIERAEIYYRNVSNM